MYSSFSAASLHLAEQGKMISALKLAFSCFSQSGFWCTLGDTSGLGLDTGVAGDMVVEDEATAGA